jgi:hypothetical protein
MTTAGEVTQQSSVDELVREAGRRLDVGDTEGALATLAPMVTDSPPVPVRFVLALTAWRLGRYDWAVDLMRQCHEEAPMNGTIAEALASLYAQVGDLGESLYMGKLATALGGPRDMAELVPASFPAFDWAFLNIQEHPLLARA